MGARARAAPAPRRSGRPPLDRRRRGHRVGGVPGRHGQLAVRPGRPRRGRHRRPAGPEPTRSARRAGAGRRRRAAHPAPARRARRHPDRARRSTGCPSAGWAGADAWPTPPPPTAPASTTRSPGGARAPAGAVHPGARRRQARLGLAALRARLGAPGHRPRQPWRRAQRQAARRLHASSRWPTTPSPCSTTPASRRPTSSARRWAARSPSSSPCAIPERVRSLTLDVHVVPQPRLAARAARPAGARRPAAVGMGIDDEGGGPVGDRSPLVPPPDAGHRLARPARLRAARPTPSPPRSTRSSPPTTAWPRSSATIAVPTLVVVGNQDILTPRGDSEELAELIPTAELVVISGAAHGLMVEHASTYNRILLDFLQRAERSRPVAGDLTRSGGIDRTVRGLQHKTAVMAFSPME